jgi:hypothetical protein
MPVTYQLDRDAGFIETRCFGALTLQEVMGHFRELEADGSLPKRLDVLLDLDDVTVPPETAQLREVTRAIDRLRARVEWGSCAIVAAPDVMFGMSRMFEVFTEALFARTSVFRTRQEAEHWLRARPPRA